MMDYAQFFAQPLRLVSVVTCLVLICASGSNDSGNLRNRQRKQILVFDAGSSGTRIHVFNVRPPAAGEHVPTVDLSVRDIQTLKVKPGLSTFARHGDLNGCRQNMEELLSFAAQFVPETQRASTPVVFKATAGLRAVEQSKAEAVLATVRAALATSGYQFQDEWADVIQGKEEAGLAWVAANYLQGTFRTEGEADSLGVIEMGGGSTQVCFEVAQIDRVQQADSFVFETALGKRYYLYAHSYLGYGQDYAQSKLRILLERTRTEDPCYPVGYKRKVAAKTPEFVTGSGDTLTCQSEIGEQLLSAPDAPGHYEYELPLRGRFVATENFFYVRKALHLPLAEGSQAMQSEATQGCSRSILPSTEQSDTSDGISADAGYPSFCFGLSYQAAMLRQLKIPTMTSADASVAQDVSVSVVRNINGGDIDWALGVAVLHFVETNVPRRQSNEIVIGSDGFVTDGGEYDRIWELAPMIIGALFIFSLCIRCARSHAYSMYVGGKGNHPPMWRKVAAEEV